MGKGFCCLCLSLTFILLLNVGTVYAAENTDAADTVDPVIHPENYSALRG